MSEQSAALLQHASQLHRQGRLVEAIETFRRALALQPDASDGWYELGYALRADGRFEDALSAYARALELGVRNPEEVHVNRGVIFSDHLRQDDEAARELHAALALAPGYLPALLNLGNLHEERGEREQALACYTRAIEGAASADPAQQEYRLEALARSAKLRPARSLDDPLIGQLRDATSAPVSRVVRANLFYALGQTYERLGDFDQAFEAFAKANRWLLREPGRRYDPARTERFMDALIGTFDSFDASVPRRIHDRAEPLFICGMFRSGSTLIEQVLAAHPQVTAGGELDYLRRLAFSRLMPFPQAMATPDPARDAALAEEYLAHLDLVFPDAGDSAYITDKRPDNFVLIGLIKRLFPSARIIHTVRNPLDTGLSIFMQHLNLQVAGYAADLGDIGHYYGQYQRLMGHWKSLYGDSILEFDYDAFVRDPRPSLERLFAFLELPFDERCLQFHAAGGTVKTASYWQVRQPLHANASGRWQHYAKHLAPLRRSLEQAGVAFDTASGASG